MYTVNSVRLFATVLIARSILAMSATAQAQQGRDSMLGAGDIVLDFLERGVLRTIQTAG